MYEVLRNVQHVGRYGMYGNRRYTPIKCTEGRSVYKKKSLLRALISLSTTTVLDQCALLLLYSSLCVAIPEHATFIWSSTKRGPWCHWCQLVHKEDTWWNITLRYLKLELSDGTASSDVMVTPGNVKSPEIMTSWYRVTSLRHKAVPYDTVTAYCDVPLARNRITWYQDVIWCHDVNSHPDITLHHHVAWRNNITSHRDVIVLGHVTPWCHFTSWLQVPMISRFQVSSDDPSNETYDIVYSHNLVFRGFPIHVFQSPFKAGQNCRKHILWRQNDNYHESLPVSL